MCYLGSPQATVLGMALEAIITPVHKQHTNSRMRQAYHSVTRAPRVFAAPPAMLYASEATWMGWSMPDVPSLQPGQSVLICHQYCLFLETYQLAAGPRLCCMLGF